LGEYDDLLQQARTRAEAFRLSAKELIPKLYLALRNENQAPADARNRIEKDCRYFWSKRTILEALPDEAKNIEKQKSGRLAQKKRDSAALSAAPLPEIRRKITIDTNGKQSEENLSPAADPYPHTSNTSADIKLGVNECSSCQELYYENNELKDALAKATKLATADKELPSIFSSTTSNQRKDVLEFEFPLRFSEVRTHMASIFKQVGDRGEVWFSGRIDKMTGQVIAAKIGRIEVDSQQHNTAVDITN
jgi:hypothetical protein